jgi:ABC-2 type transport system ATP-binding protein
MDLLTGTKLVKQYANHRALDGLSLSVPEGCIYGLLGPNGAGKTTLIRIINQITAPDEGELSFEGRRMSMNDIYRIGYLPEERGLYKKMKVGEQSLYLARLKGLSRTDALKRLKYWFEKFEITGWWDKKVEELSKGMAQKVQFITTVLHKPKLLIFDEPFSGFDPMNVDLLKQEILEMKREGATIIFSTHNMSSVEELCDHITLINRSRAILQGSVPEIRAEHSRDLLEVIMKTDHLDMAFEKEYQPIDNEYKAGLYHIKLKNRNNIPNNELLAGLMRFGDIQSFQTMLPSMHDIFVKVVKETNQTVENELQTN